MEKLLHALVVHVINDYIMKSTPRFRGPSLLLLATIHLLIFSSGLVAASVLRHGAHFVTPFASAEELRAVLALSPTAVRVSNFFLLGSAIPFGIFAVTIVSRLRFLGVRAAGTNIARQDRRVNMLFSAGLANPSGRKDRLSVEVLVRVHTSELYEKATIQPCAISPLEISEHYGVSRYLYWVLA